ncbi:MAG TPA: tetratricopeptide repeat protein [Methylophilus sp.]|nr:tetratricopeptide repeat protein [Methylophilus sp.]HQQ33628.1 tetratricopeptide repeat protein [Methylophilus sp.]
MTMKSVLLTRLLAPLLLIGALTALEAVADELKDISQLSEQGQQAQALERINAYLAANPKDAQGMFMKGIILAESGKRDEAIKAFNDLTQKYPSLPEPYNNLAVLYAEGGQYDQAKKSLETAIKTHPSYAIAHENLGDIYARMASEAYDKALQLDNGNSRAQSKLALIKDLFGTGNKTVVAAKVDPVKPAKAVTQPIRPADKKPEPAKPENTAAPANDEATIADAVNAWAKAWSNQDVDKYLASYADSFKPAKGQSRKAWEQTRRERISKPKSIAVELNNLKVAMNGAESAKVTFKQSYRADGKPIRTDKTLMLKKVGNAWLIDEEIASN